MITKYIYDKLHSHYHLFRPVVLLLLDLDALSTQDIPSPNMYIPVEAVCIITVLRKPPGDTGSIAMYPVVLQYELICIGNKSAMFNFFTQSICFLCQ